MRRFGLLVACLAGCVIAMGAPVTQQAARQKAVTFMKQHQLKADNMTMVKRQPRKASTTTADAAYYVFNADDRQGFVIISGDDRAMPVLGYAASGHFDETQMPDNMRAWLQGYADQMEWLAQHPDAVAHAPAHSVKTAISPMLATLWNQDDPYNQQCPVFLTGNRSVTGCVATAMAQVLYHLRYPAATTQAIPAYACKTAWNGSQHVQSPEVGVTTFQWDDMLLSYDGSSSSAQQTAVAWLMRCCGAAVEMDYSDADNGGSGASSSKIAPALRTYFDVDATLANRDAYTYAQWTELIYGELQSGRPVLYGGVSSGGGHEFVVDGYDGDELFHVNWGWGGKDNGFFALSVMNPGDNTGIGASSSNDGYSFSQDAVIGIKPVAQPATTGIQMTFNGISVSGTTITFSAWNWSGTTATFDFGLKYTDDDAMLWSYSSELNTNTGYGDLTYTVASDPAQADTTRKIIGVSRESGSGEWLSQMNPDIHYIEVAFDGSGSPTLTLHPTISLETTSITFPGTCYKDETQEVSVDLHNLGDEFYGVVYLFASTTQAMGDYQSMGGVTILRNGSTTTSLTFKPTTTGTYNVWIATDEAGTNVIGSTTVAITVNPFAPTSQFIFSELDIADADATSWQTDASGNILVDVYSKSLSIAPTIMNNTSTNYSETFIFRLYRDNNASWTSLGGYSSSALTIEGGATVSFTAMDFGELGYGRYKFQLESSGGTVYDSRYIITLTSGFPVWAADGERYIFKTAETDITIPANVVAADLSAYDFTTITPNANQNTLYVLDSQQAIPASLTGHNVVSGATAEQITLVDDGVHGFYSPVDFTAQSISYTRTYDSGYTTSGNGWQTICLPFEATRVEADGKPIDWFRSNSDTGKQFWLMQYAGEDGETITFTQAARLEAYTPYIIALPNQSYGSRWDLTGQPITFSGTDAAVSANTRAAVTGSAYKFVGTLTATAETSNIYALNASGNLFVKGTYSVAPFRAYFSNTSTSAGALYMQFVDSTTGIGTITQPVPPAGRLYDLQGRPVGAPRKGLYISNGKKFIK